MLPDLQYDGDHLVTDKLPRENIQLIITLEENKDSVGGGAATFSNGKWYWTYNREKTEECRYKVASWCYIGGLG